MEEFLFILGGPQGAGLETALQILSYAFASSGYNVFFDRQYYSNIKGRHSYVHASISTKSAVLSYPVDLIAAMDAETVFTHFKNLRDGGIIIYDLSAKHVKIKEIESMENKLKERLYEEFGNASIEDVIESLKRRNVKIVSIDFKEIIEDAARKFALPAKQASRYVSAILVGGVAGLTGVEKEIIRVALERKFREDIVQQNEYIIGKVMEKVEHSVEIEGGKKRKKVVASGNEIVALGKIAASLEFQSYYPITPAADESFFLEKEGIATILQTEDEIAAICSAIGASLAGSKAATCTSGPGFDLMVEAIGWAGINGVPIVITLYQRSGPSTGMPTRGGQEDLFAAVFSSHGEFPKVVIASGDHEEAFYHAMESFEIAEKYRIPVIHLLDKFIANSVASIPIPKYAGERKFQKMIGDDVKWYTGDEHDEKGHICEDSINRMEMMRRRMKKMEDIEKEVEDEKKAILYEKGRDFLLVGWGSVKRVSIKALDEMAKEGIKGSYLHIKYLLPFPSKLVSSIIDEYEMLIGIEHNYIGQLSKLISMNCRREIERKILKYNGRPMYLNEVVWGIKRILKGEKKVVMSYGA